MKDFMIDDLDGRQAVVRLDDAEEVFVALEGEREIELARRQIRVIADMIHERWGHAIQIAGVFWARAVELE